MEKLNKNWLIVTVAGAIIFIALWAFLMPRLEKSLGPKE